MSTFMPPNVCPRRMVELPVWPTSVQPETAVISIMRRYSSPVTDDSVDFVYRIEATPEQPAGEYEMEIVYILVPTF